MTDPRDPLDSMWMRDHLMRGDHAAVWKQATTDPEFLRRRDVAGDTALAVAVQMGCPETVELLLGLGAAPGGRHAEDRTCLMCALETSSTHTGRIAKSLIQHGADVNEQGVYGWTALHLATLHEPGGVRLMLELGADIESRDGEQGLTPLMLATTAGVPQTVALLVDAGAEVNAVSELGETALDLAHERDEDQEAVEELLRRAGAVSGDDLPTER